VKNLAAMREELIQEINRLTAVVQAMDAAMGKEGETVAGQDGTPLKLYKCRSQSESAKKRISEFQQEKWRLIRSVQSGAVTLESLSPDQQDMIKHVAGVAVHPALAKSAGTSAKPGAGNWNPVTLVKPTEAAVGLPHATISQEPSVTAKPGRRDVKRLRTR
jgi:hypothetical protein